MNIKKTLKLSVLLVLTFQFLTGCSARMAAERGRIPEKLENGRIAVVYQYAPFELRKQKRTEDVNKSHMALAESFVKYMPPHLTKYGVTVTQARLIRTSRNNNEPVRLPDGQQDYLLVVKSPSMKVQCAYVCHYSFMVQASIIKAGTGRILWEGKFNEPLYTGPIDTSLNYDKQPRAAYKHYAEQVVESILEKAGKTPL